MPVTAGRAEAFLCAPLALWRELEAPLLGTVIDAYQPLATRIDAAQVAGLVAAPEPEAAAATPLAPAPAPVSLEEFQRLDLRVARIEAAAAVPGADRLLQLTVELAGGERRNVFAGIRAAYAPEALVGRHVVVVTNLPPRRLRFGVSEAMGLAASGDGEGLFLIAPDAGAAPGMQVR